MKGLLGDMVKSNILKPVKDSKWASHIVIVKKTNGTLRLCMDPKRTLNPALREDFYPLPRIDDIFTEIGGHK